MNILKALLVGAGGMGKAWARNLINCPDTTIVGWVDIIEDAARIAAEAHELRDIYISGDVDKALAEVKADFVVDATIPAAHRDVTIKSLKAGVPVIGEKPMAESMADAQAMVKTSEETGKLYMVSQSRRYDARLAAYKSLIDQYIGELGILNSDFYLGPRFGGFRDEMPSPLIIDMAIHTFDAARYLCGSDPVSVYCDEFNPSWSWYKGNASATIIFEMSNGLRYNYRGSWCADGLPTSWDADWRAIGSNGTALWDGRNQPVAEVSAKKGEKITGEVDTEGFYGINGSLRDFINALRTGTTPMCECHDNIKSLAMVFAAIESARVGKKIMVSPI